MRRNAVVAIVVLAFSSPAWAEDLRTSDFTYLGAFRLPSELDYGARGMDFRPAGDGGRGSLIVIGHDMTLGEWTEVRVPALGRGDFWTLPEAALLGPLVEFDGSLMESETAVGEASPGDVACLAPRGSQTSEKCYWSINWWYNVGAVDYDAVGMSEVDGSRPRGTFHVGPRADVEFHGSRHGSYMFSVPAWYADSVLGGRELMVGMSREAGCCGSSQGPTLFAFRPFAVDSPAAGAELDAIDLVYYPTNHACAAPEVTNPSACLYPGYRACDDWVGGAFVEAGPRSAVVLAGVKGLGENGYGPAESASACNPYQGYHCDPLETQLLFYSTDDLADSAAGRLEPWELVPYAIWRPTELVRTSCPDVGGVAFDRRGGRFFLVEKGLGRGGSAAVHVWELAPATGGGVPGDGGSDGTGGSDGAIDDGSDGTGGSGGAIDDGSDGTGGSGGAIDDGSDGTGGSGGAIDDGSDGTGGSGGAIDDGSDGRGGRGRGVRRWLVDAVRRLFVREPR